MNLAAGGVDAEICVFCTAAKECLLSRSAVASEVLELDQHGQGALKLAV
jgi:hypothetical protein